MRVKNFLTEEIAKLTHATTNERESMSGVYLDFPKQLAVATDGKIMAMAHLKLPPSYALAEPVTVSEQFLSDAVKLNCDIEITQEKSFIYHAGTTASYNNISAEFPDYKKVLPPQRTEVKLGINLSLVSLLLKALSLGKKDGVSLCFDPSNPLHAVRVTKGNKTLGLVMPMRDP